MEIVSFYIPTITTLICLGLKVEKKKWKVINQIKKIKEKNRISKRKNVVVHQAVVRVVVGKHLYCFHLFNVLIYRFI